MRPLSRRHVLLIGGVLAAALVLLILVIARPFWTISNEADPPAKEPALIFLRIYGGGLDYVRGPLRFSEDGKLLKVASFNQGTQVWDLAASQSVEIIPDPPGSRATSRPSEDLARSRFGSLVAEAGPIIGTIVLLDAFTSAEIAFLDTGHGAVETIEFSPDGKTLAVVCKGQSQPVGEVVLFDVPSRQMIDVLGGHTSQVFAALFTPDGNTILSGGNDGRVLVWDAATGRRRASWVGTGLHLHSISLSPDGKSAVTAGGRSVIGWDVGTGYRRFAVTFAVNDRAVANAGHYAALSVAYFPDGQRIVSSGPLRDVTIRDAAAGRESKSLIGHRSLVRHVAVSPDGRTIASSAGGLTRQPDLVDALHLIQERNEVYLWDAETGTKRALFPAPSAEGPVAFSPDGQFLAVAAEGNHLELRDLATGRILQSLIPPEDVGKLTCFAFSPDGRLIAAGGQRPDVRYPQPAAKGLVWIWKVADGRMIATAETGSGHSVNSVAWRADGRQLLAGTYKRSIYLWELR